ncbi:hypothetical protein SLEP1_g51030 [Rubroshorea leprosula]|uniref:Uncharacterized protein n=1 Tax=Rubroshorea leprosula TaxID=152421 RepID=A0AAV5M557_9ROSI|nr:hypothetical protein SLEP1_g51030 [Rubroshorea leprosula]
MRRHGMLFRSNSKQALCYSTWVAQKVERDTVLEDSVLDGVYISTPIYYAYPTEVLWHERS